MNISLDEAIDIYAKASRAWYGTAAIAKTREHIEKFQLRGDLEGVRVWERVGRAIEECEMADQYPRVAAESKPPNSA